MADIIIRSAPNYSAAQALIEGLIGEYDGRYGVESRPGGARSELERYPVDLFAPPLGDFLLLQRNGETIAGGAFMSHDEESGNQACMEPPGVKAARACSTHHGGS